MPLDSCSNNNIEKNETPLIWLNLPPGGITEKMRDLYEKNNIELWWLDNVTIKSVEGRTNFTRKEFQNLLTTSKNERWEVRNYSLGFDKNWENLWFNAWINASSTTLKGAEVWLSYNNKNTTFNVDWKMPIKNPWEFSIWWSITDVKPIWWLKLTTKWWIDYKNNEWITYSWSVWVWWKTKSMGWKVNTGYTWWEKNQNINVWWSANVGNFSLWWNYRYSLDDAKKKYWINLGYKISWNWTLTAWYSSSGEVNAWLTFNL